ncbi:MAG TPA: hypothetical protein VHX65_13835 [Pirellulales bacterium]|jgi:hypothetical protein|nr:hypothetical protein [Pirellulales bacterium]
MSLPTDPVQPPVPEAAQVSADAKPRWPVSRVVLLALLVVAIGLLGIDWLRGRIPRNRAYDLLAAQMPSEDEGASKGPTSGPRHAISADFQFWTVEKVHELLKRLPDKTDVQASPNHIDSIVTETYRFPGAFKNYLLVVQYDKRAHVAPNGPRTTMTGVRRSS